MAQQICNQVAEKERENTAEEKEKTGRKKVGTTKNLQKLMKDIQYKTQKPRKRKQDKYKHVACMVNDMCLLD